MYKRNFLTIIVAVLGSLALVFSGCSGDGSGGSSTSSTGTSDPRFNVKGSSQLIALSSTVAATSSSKGALETAWSKVTGGSLLEYKVVNQGLSEDEVRARAKGKAASAALDGPTPVQKGTNLLAVDVAGNAELAIAADFMVKVMYSVTDPKGEYVYLALDTGFINPDGNDYTPFIASNNCAFYRVKISDNTYSCVKEGVYVQPIDDTYNKTVSANTKPIQFDADGNMYFPGTSFTRVCKDDGGCTMAVANWRPRIYRVSVADWSVVALTQDNQHISYYLALQSGQIAYQSLSPSGTTIYLWQPDPSGANVNGITVDMTGPSNNINFFTNDTYNTIIYGGFTTNGIRFAKPAAGAGVEKALLDTSMFKPSTYATDFAYVNTSGCSFVNYDFQSNKFPPAKVIVGDDGKLYGVFGPTTKPNYVLKTDGSGRYDCAKTTYSSVYKVFQVLPFLSVPKAEIETPRDLPYESINAFGGTPFQVANGKFFYKETKERVGYGVYDVINMIDLKNRVKITLLNDVNTFYEIYSWRVRGNKLYFSALDLARTVVVSGTIDTSLASTTALQQTFLHIQDMASAMGATSRVQDIEGLAPLPPLQLATGAPAVKQAYLSAANRYSMSLEFNKLMTESAVEANTTVVQGTSPVATLKVWINNFLHLIPDLDNNGTSQPNDALLDLTGSKPFDFNTPYDIAIAASVTDSSGLAMAADYSASFTTRPEFGWYSTDQVAKFAGSQPVVNPGGGAYYPAWAYDLHVGSDPVAAPTGTTDNVPADFRLQFKAKNYMTNGVQIMLWDNMVSTITTTPVSWNGQMYNYGGIPYNNRLFMNLYLGSNSGLEYTGYYSRYFYDWYMCMYYGQYCGVYEYYYTTVGRSSQYAPLIFNGDWLTYRIDMYGNRLKVSYSQDGNTFTNIGWTWYDDSVGYPVSANEFTDVFARDSSRAYKLIMIVSQPVDIDDLQISSLDSAGNVVYTAPSSFSNNDLAVDASGSLSNPGMPNLQDRVTSVANPDDPINGWNNPGGSNTNYDN